MNHIRLATISTDYGAGHNPIYGEHTPKLRRSRSGDSARKGIPPAVIPTGETSSGDSSVSLDSQLACRVTEVQLHPYPARLEHYIHLH